MSQELTRTAELDGDVRVGRTVLTTGALAGIAGLAARSVPGVVSLDGTPDVPVGPEDVQDGRTEVSLAVVAAYDVALTELAAEIRHAVAETVGRMTGLEVVAVDVDVSDVQMVPAAPGPGAG